jgi:sigma-B regulation protein RsbU (phosphoserine phosphatase)
VEVAHFYLSATEVAGDFYLLEAITAQEATPQKAGVDTAGRVAIAIGDVAGHGISSGLMMSAARAALQVQLRADPRVERVFEMLNAVVCRSAGQRLLTTLCYALLEPARRRLHFACAGHLYPYRISVDGTVMALESTAYPLGVREQLSLEPRTVELDPGDALLFASDGLVEWRRLGGEEPYGFDRLERALRQAANRGAVGLRDAVLADLERFLGSGERVVLERLAREDDLTVLVVKLA